MENELEKYTSRGLTLLLGSILSDIVKIESIMFDKYVTTVRGEDNELSFAEEMDINLNEMKNTMILLDVGVPNLFLGIYYTRGNKKPYRLINIAKLAGSKFILEGTIPSTSYSQEDIKEVLEDLIPKLSSMEKTDKGMRALTSMIELPRMTNEILGILHFEHSLPITIINKAIRNLPDEIRANPVTTLLRINSYLFEKGLMAWVSHSANVLKEIGYISNLTQQEQSQKARVFNAAIAMIDDDKRKELTTYALTAHPDQIDKLSGLLEGLIKFTSPNGQSSQGIPQRKR